MIPNFDAFIGQLSPEDQQRLMDLRIIPTSRELDGLALSTTRSG